MNVRAAFAAAALALVLLGGAGAWADVRVREMPRLDERQRFLLEQQAARPFPRLPDNPRGASPLAILNLALAEFWTGSAVRANQRLSDFLPGLRQQSFYKGRRTVDKPGTPADADQFHFLIAQFLYRIHKLFGAAGDQVPGALSAANDGLVRDILFDWARTECRLSDADPKTTWTVWDSENHTALRDSSCWAAAAIVGDQSSWRTYAYQDGSNALAQLAAWTAFIKSFLRERVRHGGLVEFFSPTYAQYTLLNVYLYADFAEDRELRDLSRAFLDLWWSLWAQEQVDALHGGSKTRSYFQRIHDGTALPTTAWLYFGLGRRPDGLAPGEAAMATSLYVPPALVGHLALADGNRPAFDVLTRAPGLSGDPTLTGIVSKLDPTRNGILRVSRVTPDFVMGFGMLPLLPDKAWSAISSQNRWAGLVFAGGDRLSRIVPSVLLPPGQKSYNALLGVQNGATQLVRGIFPVRARAPAKFGVFFGKPLRRLEQGDWAFVEAAGYAAVRPVFGGWRPDPDSEGWMVLNDPRSPVIIQAAEKRHYPNLSAFITAVTAMPIRVEPNRVSVTGLGDAGRLTLGLDQDGTLEIDGKPVDFEPPFVLKSPFVNQAVGSSKVEITVGQERLELDFGR